MKKIFLFLVCINLFISNGYAGCSPTVWDNSIFKNKSANEYLFLKQNIYLECDDTDCPNGKVFYSHSKTEYPIIGKNKTSTTGYKKFTCTVEGSGDYWNEEVGSLQNCTPEQTKRLCKKGKQVVCDEAFPYELPYILCANQPCECPATTCEEADLYNQAIKKLQNKMQALQGAGK